MIDEARILLREELPGGSIWSHVLYRHQQLRLTDLEGGANASVLLYNRDHLLERYNMPDTLKAQHVAYLTQGRVLYSDMGRILCSIVEDTVGWHDTVTGCSDAALVERKHGQRRFQEHRNGFHRNARDSFVIELSKWGLGARDLVPNANFFSKLAADADGTLTFVTEHSKPGGCVTLRAEMNVLVVMSTCPHPLDPLRAYAPKRIGVTIASGDPPGPEDECRRSRPENGRGFINTERMFLGRA
jgi:urea carboxylase-associated protein 2